MIKSDNDNVMLVESVDSVDDLNARFYGKFPYPWRPLKLDYLADTDIETDMLNQELGSWTHSLIPKRPKVWVAGCGTNQAVITALRFPNAQVLGSDISPTSLKLCEETAKKLGIRNLELRQETINHQTHYEEFDYVICTGVIHHNADPKHTLDKLTQAVSPGGILELMVYNRYHNLLPTIFQKAVRMLNRSTTSVDFDSELVIVRKLINNYPAKNLLAGYLLAYRNYTDDMLSKLTDELLQPVLYSYTVESFNDLVTSCDLELVAPCISSYNRAIGRYDWNIRFEDPFLQDRYDSLPDIERWQVTNLLLLDEAPMLWFYAQRKDSGRQLKSEKELCDEFLELAFEKVGTTQHTYVMGTDGTYKLSAESIPYPVPTRDAVAKKILEAVDSRTRMRDVFRRAGINTSFQLVNHARIHLTTSAFPYLRAVGKAAPAINPVSGPPAH